MALETESQHFEAIRADLVRTHAGQFVLIKADSVDGVFTTFAEAFEAGVRRHGLEPFMVRQITAEDAPILLPALNAGLIFGS
ncbi:MAG: hypothetical protein C0506_12880 [Anaerolinea sp.]|nr:hypothetical protein [Anaerolinea sp.]